MSWLLKSCEDINDQVLTKFQQNLIQAVDVSMHSEIYKLINIITNKEELPQQQIQSLIRKAIHQTAFIVIAYQCCQLHTKFDQPSSVMVNFHM